MTSILDYDNMLEAGLFDVDYGIMYTDMTHEFFLLVEAINDNLNNVRQTLIEHPIHAGDERIAIHSRVYPKMNTWVLETSLEETIDLSGYMTRNEAFSRFQPKGDYLTQPQTDEWYQPKGNYLTQWAADNAYQPRGNYLTQTQADNYYQPKGSYLTKYQADTSYQPKGDYATKQDIINAVGRTLYSTAALTPATTVIYGEPNVKIMGGVVYVNFTLRLGMKTTSGYNVFSFRIPSNNYLMRNEQKITAPLTNAFGYVNLRFVTLSEQLGMTHMSVIADQTITAGSTIQFNFAIPIVTK